jgi:AraC-like DNA-binding protein
MRARAWSRSDWCLRRSMPRWRPLLDGADCPCSSGWAGIWGVLALVSASLPIRVAGGTRAAWATPPHAVSPAGTGRRLVIQTTFSPATLDRRALEARVQALGFANLAAYLTDRYLDQERSLLAIAHELGVTIHIIRGLRDALGIRPHGGVRARGRSRQAANDQRAAAHAIELGFADLRGYLVDRYTGRAWTIPRLADELGIGESVVTRLLRTMGVTRIRATAPVAAAAERGQAQEAVLVAERRQARLAALGFATLAAYLQDRRVDKGWSLRRMRAELKVSAVWLRKEVAQMDIERRVQPRPAYSRVSSVSAARSRRAEASSAGATSTRTPSLCSCGYCPPASSADTTALKP